MEQLPKRGFLWVEVIVGQNSSVVVEYEPTIEGVDVREERRCNNKQRHYGTAAAVNLQGVELNFKVHLVNIQNNRKHQQDINGGTCYLEHSKSFLSEIIICTRIKYSINKVLMFSNSYRVLKMVCTT